MVVESPGEPSRGRSHALEPHNRPNPSPPEDVLGGAPRRPPAEGLVEDVEGPVDAQALHLGNGSFSCLEVSVGDNVRRSPLMSPETHEARFRVA